MSAEGVAQALSQLIELVRLWLPRHGELCYRYLCGMSIESAWRLKKVEVEIVYAVEGPDMYIKPSGGHSFSRCER